VPRITTLTLDDDVAAKVAAESRLTGRPFRAVVNEALRAGLEDNTRRQPQPFRVRASSMGLRPGLSIDNVEGLIEELEGPWHR
jgi:hypothetical protein